MEDGVNLLTGSERNFLAALLHHVQYELATKGYPGRVLMTVRQLADVHERLTGRTLSMSTYYTHANKFVGRPGRAASRRELLRRERVGEWGEASTFELTGLVEAFAGVTRAGLSYDGLRRVQGLGIDAGTPGAAGHVGVEVDRGAGGAGTGRSAPTACAEHSTCPQPAGRAGIGPRPKPKPCRAEVPRRVSSAKVKRPPATIPADSRVARQRCVPDTPDADDGPTGRRTLEDGPDSKGLAPTRAGYECSGVGTYRPDAPGEVPIDPELDDLIRRLGGEEGD